MKPKRETIRLYTVREHYDHLGGCGCVSNIKKEIFVPRRRGRCGYQLFWLPIRPCVCRLRVLSARSAWPPGFDVADNEIVRQCEAGDLLITADIPLAAQVLKRLRLLSPGRTL